MKFPNQAALIKKIRKDGHLTQNDLAKLMRVHTQMISNIERGLMNIPVKRMKRLFSLVNKDTCRKAYLMDARLYFDAEWK